MTARANERGMRKQARRASVILGMHRSGTSALAGAVHFAGVARPQTLIPADEHNSRGYWECAPLVKAHDNFLRKIGSSWKDWRHLGLDQLSVATQSSYRKIVSGIVEQEYPGDSCIVVKDPRASRFYPLLNSALDDLGFSSTPLLIFAIHSKSQHLWRGAMVFLWRQGCSCGCATISMLNSQRGIPPEPFCHSKNS